MEDQKLSTLTPIPRRERVFTSAALVIVSLLLTVTVSVIIYQNVSGSGVSSFSQQQAGSEQQKSDSKDVHVSVTIKSENNKVNEDITYDQANSVAYYYGDDGSFEVDDFGKGIHLTKDSASGICYLSAVGSLNYSGIHDFEEMIKENDGSQLEIDTGDSDGPSEKAMVLPGEITDTSFIPDQARKECVRGYKWLTFVPLTQEERQKRDLWLCYRCYLRYGWYYSTISGRYRYGWHYKCYYWYADDRADCFTTTTAKP